MMMTTLPSSVVCDTADYFKFNDSLAVGGGGEQLSHRVTDMVVL